MANFLLSFFTLDVRAPVHARTFVAVMDFWGEVNKSTYVVTSMHAF